MMSPAHGHRAMVSDGRASLFFASWIIGVMLPAAMIHIIDKLK